MALLNLSTLLIYGGCDVTGKTWYNNDLFVLDLSALVIRHLKIKAQIPNHVQILHAINLTNQTIALLLNDTDVFVQQLPLVERLHAYGWSNYANKKFVDVQLLLQ